MLQLALENVKAAVDRELKYLTALEAAELLRQVQLYCQRRLEKSLIPKVNKTRQGSGKQQQNDAKNSPQDGPG